MIRKYLEDHYDFVEKPNHPYIINGPDFLADDGEQLFALFICEGPLDFEFIYRVIATRLVYPVETKMVLVHPYNEVLSKYQVLFCDKILVKKKGKGFGLDQNPLVRRTASQFKKLKRLQGGLFKRQSDVYERSLKCLNGITTGSTELITDLSVENGFIRKSFRNKIENTERIIDGLYSFRHTMFTQRHITSQKREVLELEKLRLYSIASDFQFDEGWPVNSEVQDRFLNLNRLPNSGFDPFRIVRVLSLYGWNIRTLETSDQLQKEMSHES